MLRFISFILLLSAAIGCIWHKQDGAGRCCNFIICNKGEQPVICKTDDGPATCESCPDGYYNDRLLNSSYSNSSMPSCLEHRSCPRPDQDIDTEGNATHNAKCKCVKEPNLYLSLTDKCLNNACPEGQSFDNATEKCMECSNGTFKADYGTGSCVPCTSCAVIKEECNITHNTVCDNEKIPVKETDANMTGTIVGVVFGVLGLLLIICIIIIRIIIYKKRSSNASPSGNSPHSVSVNNSQLNSSSSKSHVHSQQSASLLDLPLIDLQPLQSSSSVPVINSQRNSLPPDNSLISTRLLNSAPNSSQTDHSSPSIPLPNSGSPSSLPPDHSTTATISLDLREDEAVFSTVEDQTKDPDLTGKYARRLRDNLTNLQRSLIINEDLLAFLVQEDLISPNLSTQLRKTVERGKRGEAAADLMDVILLCPQGPDKTFELFVQALVESQNYHLAKQLDESLAKKYEKQKKGLDDNGSDAEEKKSLLDPDTRDGLDSLDYGETRTELDSVTELKTVAGETRPRETKPKTIGGIETEVRAEPEGRAELEGRAEPQNTVPKSVF